MVCKEFEKTKMEGEKGFAVILTNPLKQTTVRMQKSSKNQVDGYSVCWDYHVVFVLKRSSMIMIVGCSGECPLKSITIRH